MSGGVRWPDCSLNGPETADGNGSLGREIGTGPLAAHAFALAITSETSRGFRVGMYPNYFMLVKRKIGWSRAMSTHKIFYHGWTRMNTDHGRRGCGIFLIRSGNELVL